MEITDEIRELILGRRIGVGAAEEVD